MASTSKYDVWRIGPPDKGKSEPRNEKFKAGLLIGQLYKFFHEYAQPGYYRSGDTESTPYIYLIKAEGVEKQTSPMVYKKVEFMGRIFFVKFQADLYEEIYSYFVEHAHLIRFVDVQKTRKVVMG